MVDPVDLFFKYLKLIRCCIRLTIMSDSKKLDWIYNIKLDYNPSRRNLNGLREIKAQERTGVFSLHEYQA
jgi:hypothetical protein